MPGLRKGGNRSRRADSIPGRLFLRSLGRHDSAKRHDCLREDRYGIVQIWTKTEEQQMSAIVGEKLGSLTAAQEAIYSACMAMILDRESIDGLLYGERDREIHHPSFRSLRFHRRGEPICSPMENRERRENSMRYWTVKTRFGTYRVDVDKSEILRTTSYLIVKGIVRTGENREGRYVSAVSIPLEMVL